MAATYQPDCPARSDAVSNLRGTEYLGCCKFCYLKKKWSDFQKPESRSPGACAMILLPRSSLWSMGGFVLGGGPGWEPACESWRPAAVGRVWGDSTLRYQVAAIEGRGPEPHTCEFTRLGAWHELRPVAHPSRGGEESLERVPKESPGPPQRHAEHNSGPRPPPVGCTLVLEPDPFVVAITL